MLEVACFTPEAAIIAASAGADRIELCDDQEAGGTTPPLEWLQRVKAAVSVPVFAMIRPRGGDFLYDDGEFVSMKDAIERFRPIADGFVFGLLDAERRVDTRRTAGLVLHARPLPCTFHRAFDHAVDLDDALDAVIVAGCRAILSSGGASSAFHGVNMLRKLVQDSRGRITIVAGGGVRSENLAHIRSVSGASIFHTAATLQDDTLPSVEQLRAMKHTLEDPSL